MTQTLPGPSPITCRRCRREYLLAGGLLPACPHCGAAPVPLWKRIGRHNGLCAVLCVLALVTLIIAINVPFISMNKMGLRSQFTLLDGIMELFRTNKPAIAIVLLVFSVIFPFAKLIALLTATTSLVKLSTPARKRLHFLAVITGKYSLLDILVVAIVIVLVKFKGMAEAEAHWGTTLFCVAIFLSIAAGFAVKLDDQSEPA